ncbi:SMR family transporter [uncultured Aquitalea sp.]|uniref:DMT family transporter n=1 Tax=uncultured Aquitalea sp. TaxID=540272 RepID=UPI0025D0A3E1|nr:SMR family transporter [uncultured Aquitalea sp.]
MPQQLGFAWAMLLASIVAEIIGNLALRQSQGLSRLLPSLASCLCYLSAIWLMGLALRRLDMGLTYAVWAAGGTAGTALLGIWLYGEAAGPMRLAGLGLIAAGVVALNLQGGH